ncbi:MAG: 16S rRNA (guanine(966)-N(2))-methyltransferase RsmD [Parachlamydiaceae bacterium]
MHIIAGAYKNRTLATPKSALTRPTSAKLRETLFNICQGNIAGAHFLDLFAGSGAMGLEALSRGAQSATFVDSSKESIQCISKNIEVLGVKKLSKVLLKDVFMALEKFVKESLQFDIVYIDPPYEKKNYFEGQLTSYSQRLLLAFDTLPLVKEGGLIYIEDIAPHFSIGLKTLQLLSSRRAGKATLYEFQKRTV